MKKVTDAIIFYRARKLVEKGYTAKRALEKVLKEVGGFPRKKRRKSRVLSSWPW